MRAMVATAVGAVLAAFLGLIGLVLAVPADRYPSDAHPGRGRRGHEDEPDAGLTGRRVGDVSTAVRRPRSIEPLGSRQRVLRRRQPVPVEHDARR